MDEKEEIGSCSLTFRWRTYRSSEGKVWDDYSFPSWDSTFNFLLSDLVKLYANVFWAIQSEHLRD